MLTTELSPLAAALKAEFGDTELHGIIIAAERSIVRDEPYWQKLRRAAIEAAGCAECKETRR
jgi:hypothetical protein